MRPVLAYYCEHPDPNDWSHPTSKQGRSRIASALSHDNSCPNAVPLVRGRRRPWRKTNTLGPTAPRGTMSVSDLAPIELPA